MLYTLIIPKKKFSVLFELFKKERKKVNTKEKKELEKFTGFSLWLTIDNTGKFLETYL